MPVGTFRLCLYTELGLEMLGNLQGVPISSVFISIGLLQNNKGQICQISVGSKGQNIMGQRCQINVGSKVKTSWVKDVKLVWGQYVKLIWAQKVKISWAKEIKLV